MNVHFSKASDEWSTPQDFFDKLNTEFNFNIDGAATLENTKCDIFFTCAESGGVGRGDRIFVNPPYSKLKLFLELAAKWQRVGATVVMVIPSRTDTRAFHQHVWDETKNSPRAEVQIRFIKGRLKFGGSKNSAPFPSAVIIFKPTS